MKKEIISAIYFFIFILSLFFLISCSSFSTLSNEQISALLAKQYSVKTEDIQIVKTKNDNKGAYYVNFRVKKNDRWEPEIPASYGIMISKDTSGNFIVTNPLKPYEGVLAHPDTKVD